MALKRKIIISFLTLASAIFIFNFSNIQNVNASKYYIFTTHGGYQKTPNPPKIMKTKLHTNGLKWHKGLPKALKHKKFASVKDPFAATQYNNSQSNVMGAKLKYFSAVSFGKRNIQFVMTQAGGSNYKALSYVKTKGYYRIKVHSFNSTFKIDFKIKHGKLYYMYNNDNDGSRYLKIYKYRVNKIE